MKNSFCRLFVLLLVLLVFGGVVYAADNYNRQTTDGIACPETAVVKGFIVRGTTAGDYANWYENTGTVAGSPIMDVIVGANGTASIILPNGILFTNDVYVDVGTATTTAITVYSRS